MNPSWKTKPTGFSLRLGILPCIFVWRGQLEFYDDNRDQNKGVFERPFSGAGLLVTKLETSNVDSESFGICSFCSMRSTASCNDVDGMSVSCQLMDEWYCNVSNKTLVARWMTQKLALKSSALK